MIRSSKQLILELLEDRTLMSTCHVTRLSDSGVGKGFRGDLRYCINKVNAEPGPDAIDFTVTGTINLTQPLPAISEDLVLEGPGADKITVRRNTGGNYRIFLILSGVDAQISGLTIQNGGNVDSGGGIWNKGSLTISSTELSLNQAQYGGAINNGGILTMISCTVTNNQAGGGGGIWSSGASVTIIDSIVHGNSADSGGGVFNRTSLSIHNSRVSGNIAVNDGGGIQNHDIGSLSVEFSTVSDNQAGRYGGGIHNPYHVVPGDLRIGYSTLSGNTAADGGGLFTDSTATVRNSTFTGNSATRGGGIRNDADLVLAHSTISGNTATSEGGGLNTFTYFGPASTYLSHSIISGNTAGAGLDAFGALASSDYNLFGDSDCGVGDCNYSSTDLLDIDPLVGSLQDNGGPTLTMELLPGSPAIDAGDPNVVDPPPWDQRGPGFPRIVNGTIEIGAFEVQATGAPGRLGVRSRFPGTAVLVTAAVVGDLSFDDNRLFLNAKNCVPGIANSVGMCDLAAKCVSVNDWECHGAINNCVSRRQIAPICDTYLHSAGGVGAVSAAVATPRFEFVDALALSAFDYIM